MFVKECDATIKRLPEPVLTFGMYIGSLWNFFEIPNVPPTNNHAKRQLRPLVISKKLIFGTQSERESRFIERIFSVVACKQQKDALDFIIQALYLRASLQKNLDILQPV